MIGAVRRRAARSLALGLMTGLLMGMALTLGGRSAFAQSRDESLYAAAQAEQPALMATLRELVEIESGSHDVDGLHRLADLCVARLRSLGLSIERRRVQPGPGGDVIVATLKGSGTLKLMLQAHMDTVYPRGTLTGQPYRIDGNRVYGPGIADDKGGIAVILSTLRILLDRDWREFETLTVLLNPDEEIGSPGTGELIARLGEAHDVVLSFEPTAAKDVARIEGLLLGTAGIARARMIVRGRSSHAGAAPDMGRNALYELAFQMLQTRELARDVAGAQLNWTVAEATGPTNQIPETAQAEADVRITLPGAERELEAALRQKIGSARLIDDTETRLDMALARPPFDAGPRGRALAERAQAIYAEIGRELWLVPMTGGGTDAAFAARSGKPVVVESFGLAGFGFHARDEYIEIDSIVPRLYLATRLITELSRRGP